MNAVALNFEPSSTHDEAFYGKLFLDLEREKLALLKVNQKIDERKRAFFENGIETPSAERNTLHAERQRLEITVQTMKIEALQAKEAARALKMRTFAALLISKAQAAGLGSIVEEARAESLAAVEAAGLIMAYRMKGPA